MDKHEYQRPEGVLLESAAKMKGISARKGAREASLSDARWRQIVNGYASVGAGQVVAVEGPPETVARMALAVGVTAEQLRGAGRADAADKLLRLAGMQAESEWQSVGTALERLVAIREQIDAVIDELANTPVSIDRPEGAPPAVEVDRADE